ncbi:MAG: hypothetical protein IRZ07_29335 [Microbispora sp.]|nr:hypothetical protein [Microbispora sp.]
MSYVLTAIVAATIGGMVGAGMVGITAGRRIHHLDGLLDAERAVHKAAAEAEGGAR